MFHVSLPITTCNTIDIHAMQFRISEDFIYRKRYIYIERDIKISEHLRNPCHYDYLNMSCYLIYVVFLKLYAGGKNHAFRGSCQFTKCVFYIVLHEVSCSCEYGFNNVLFAIHHATPECLKNNQHKLQDTDTSHTTSTVHYPKSPMLHTIHSSLFLVFYTICRTMALNSNCTTSLISVFVKCDTMTHIYRSTRFVRVSSMSTVTE